jgi:hypothetical protein
MINVTMSYSDFNTVSYKGNTKVLLDNARNAEAFKLCVKEFGKRCEKLEKEFAQIEYPGLSTECWTLYNNLLVKEIALKNPTSFDGKKYVYVETVILSEGVKFF